MKIETVLKEIVTNRRVVLKRCDGRNGCEGGSRKKLQK